ncbi:hypothetical protein EV183_001960 [Coemansia sp. RSA 2336]|nr:hypothetical protein EV183_001960 [Coemansia sp. RSA 2336]
MADNANLLTRGSRAVAMKRRARQKEVEEVQFDPKERYSFLTGFHKRKVQRREKAAAEAKVQKRQEFLQIRKERRQLQREELMEKLMNRRKLEEHEEDDEDAESEAEDMVLSGPSSVTTVTVTRGVDPEDLEDQTIDNLDRRLTPQEVAQKLERDLLNQIEKDQNEDNEDDKQQHQQKKQKKFRYETKAKRAATRSKAKVSKNKKRTQSTKSAASSSRRRK